MKYISRKLFNSLISDKKLVKALALLIYIKKHFPASAISHYSEAKISRITGLSRGSIKKRLSTLNDLELTEIIINKHNEKVLLLKKVRNLRFGNIEIAKFEFSSIINIEKS